MPGAAGGEIVGVILGASQWPKSPSWQASPTFANSAKRFEDYLLSRDGLSLNPELLKSFFDDPRAPSDIDAELDEFLERSEKRLGGEIKDLIVFYTGHGAFSEGDQKYCLSLRTSRIGQLGVSAYRVASLSRTLNRRAPNARKFIIIDACFAGAAPGEFFAQSDASKRMESETIAAFPEAGTALLCAASSADVALAPTDGKYTMFCEGLMQALETGSPGKQSLLSLHDVRELTDGFIREKFRDLAVKPEVHNPDQRLGDVGDLPLFPNPALRQTGLERQFGELRKLIEVQNDRLATLEKRLGSAADPDLIREIREQSAASAAAIKEMLDGAKQGLTVSEPYTEDESWKRSEDILYRWKRWLRYSDFVFLLSFIVFVASFSLLMLSRVDYVIYFELGGSVLNYLLTIAATAYVGIGLVILSLFGFDMVLRSKNFEREYLDRHHGPLIDHPIIYVAHYQYIQVFGTNLFELRRFLLSVAIAALAVLIGYLGIDALGTLRVVP